MHRPRILAIIQAGGAGGRMEVLTRETPKPALPFAGSHRLIDVPLSNLRNSGISEIWVSVQFLSQVVAEAVGNGKAWDLDRHHGGLKIIMPQQGSGSLADQGFVDGNAEELLQNRDAIRQHGADAVLVLSADHVYRLDYAEVVDEHLRRGAECTVVTTKVGTEAARNHATVEIEDSGRVSRVEYKPEDPQTGVVATEVFVYEPDALIEVLEERHRALSLQADTDGDPDTADTTDSEADGSLLGDFGEHLLPALVDRGQVWAHPLDGYWRDLGRPETYFAAHQDLLDGTADLFDADWPLRTNGDDRLPARLRTGSQIEDSLVSPGCDVAGTVRRSVLGPGVRVAAGAVVEQCVIFDDVRIERGARLTRVIAADGAVVGVDAVVGAGTGSEQPPTTDELTLIGRESRIGDGQVVGPGARLEPGTTA